MWSMMTICVCPSIGRMRKSNPYSMSEYQDLLENNLREGSWVEINAQNIYITKKGNQEES